MDDVPCNGGGWGLYADMGIGRRPGGHPPLRSPPFRAASSSNRIVSVSGDSICSSTIMVRCG
jgi:hypothetical protein